MRIATCLGSGCTYFFNANDILVGAGLADNCESASELINKTCPYSGVIPCRFQVDSRSGQTDIDKVNRYNSAQFVFSLVSRMQ